MFSGVPGARRVLRGLHVRVEREGVHQRPVAAARAVGGAEVADERGRRVRRAGAAGPVAAARRERAAEHLHVRPRGLDRVVAAREQVGVLAGREVAAAGAELRLPERAQVRLVADDRGPHLRQRRHQRGRPGGEVGAVGRGLRRVAAEPVPDDDGELHVGCAPRPRGLAGRARGSPAGGARPRCHIAETAAASKPASRETSTCDCANAGPAGRASRPRCRAGTSSPAARAEQEAEEAARPRSCRAGGRLAARGRSSLVVAASWPSGRSSLRAAPVVGAAPDEVSSPLPPESTTARITPPMAAAATTAASTAFLTGSEATLARPWLHLSKSS